MEYHNSDEPIYVISVAARLLEVHPQTLRYYERAGLLKPTRSSGKIRLYSQREIERLRKIMRLTTELGVNLAGAEVIIDLTERLEKLQQQSKQREEQLLAEIEALREELSKAHPE
jgi:MerR family transcriptional regulator/heat shock protein HspR